MPGGNMGIPFGSVGNWNPKLGIAGGAPMELWFGLAISCSWLRSG